MEPYVTPDTLEAKTLHWLDRVAPYAQHRPELNLARSALLVVDMQPFVLDPASPTFTCGGPVILPSLKHFEHLAAGPEAPKMQEIMSNSA